MNIMIRKRDGTLQPYNADIINRAIERVCYGLDDPVGKVVQIATETELTLFDGITTEEFDQAIIQAAVQNIKDDPAFDVIASRLLLTTIYKRVLGDFRSYRRLKSLHAKRFAPYIRHGVQEGLLDPALGKVFDLAGLSETIDVSRDSLLNYIGITTMMNRYMLSSRSRTLIETPQYFWMRAAMGLSLREKDPTSAAASFYHKISRLEYVPAGSVLVNVGTVFPHLSNCFVMEMHDDLDHIGKTVSDVMKLTKSTGGIGLSVTKLRAEGSPIRKTNSLSTGPVPFMNVIDSTIRAVSRGGKKFGALCFYIENWHIDFAQFLDLKQNAGDPYRRTRTANTAVWISDEFMKRVKEDADWYLFDPQEVPDLNELYGSAFSRRYNEYVALADAGKMRMVKKIRAREQFTAILVSLQTTSHPWLTWKDTVNNRALNNNTGTIHLSNLCTEICLPQDRDSIAVCNLASVNLSQHLAGRKIEWKKLEHSTRSAVRLLDNLVDITESDVPETTNANRNNRAVGLGIMGFSDILEKLGQSYESDEAYELIDVLMEHISYYAIDESCELAKEKGSYPNFRGSRWSKGMVPFDTLTSTEQDRGVIIAVPRKARLDWNRLRKKVKRGIRNATLMAIAPTANIALIANTTPGLDPRFTHIFSRATGTGKFMEVNTNLVADLKKIGVWEQVRETLLRSQGTISSIDAIPAALKQVYRTSFELSPSAFIEIAARAQKWIDQAISRNMYLETREVPDMIDIYATAWEKGVKTTYYLHTKPRHTAEQSTTKVNKAETIARGRVFGFGRSIQAQTVEQKPVMSCPVDPAERAQCEGCQ